MNEPTDCRQKCCGCVAVEQSPKDSSIFPDNCRCAPLMRQLIHQELKHQRDRVAKEEAAQWERAFGAAAPTDRNVRRELIIRIASARAFLTNMNKPSAA